MGQAAKGHSAAGAVRIQSIAAAADLPFRQAMRQLVGAVTIVTTSAGEARAGLTATAVCSVSAEPPRLLACVNRFGETYRMLGQGRTMCINVLAAAQEPLARRFAGMDAGAEEDRFATGGWQTLATGAPCLPDALAAFDCHVSMIMDTGSHGIVIGDIQAIHIGSGGAPLLYADAQFTTIAGLTG